MKTKKPLSENITLIFSKYLQSKGLRQTPERFAILSEIYLFDTPFSLQSLGERLAKKRFLVSLGTLYNTIRLLLDCGLIKPYRLEKNQPRYEKTKNVKPHDYLVLADSKEVLEFSDERLAVIQKNIEKLFDVEIYDHSLIFYGRRKTQKIKNEES